MNRGSIENQIGTDDEYGISPPSRPKWKTPFAYAAGVLGALSIIVLSAQTLLMEDGQTSFSPSENSLPAPIAVAAKPGPQLPAEEAPPPTTPARVIPSAPAMEHIPPAPEPKSLVAATGQETSQPELSVVVPIREEPKPEAPSITAIPPPTAAPAPLPKVAVATSGPEPTLPQQRPVAPAPRNNDFDYSGIQLSTREARIGQPEGLRKIPVAVLKEYLPITSKKWRKWTKSLGADREAQMAKVPAAIREVFEAQRDAFLAKAIAMTCLKYPQREGCKTLKRSELIEYADMSADYLGQNAKPLEVVVQKMAISLNPPSQKASSTPVRKPAAKQKQRVAKILPQGRQATVPDPCVDDVPENSDGLEMEQYEDWSETYLEVDDAPLPYPSSAPVRQVAPLDYAPVERFVQPVVPYPHGGAEQIAPIVIPRNQVRRALPPRVRY